MDAISQNLRQLLKYIEVEEPAASAGESLTVDAAEIESLLDILADKQQEATLRYEAAQFLAQVKPRSAIPRLLEIFNDETDDLRFLALLTLGRVLRKKDKNLLEEKLNDAEFGFLAIIALTEIEAELPPHQLEVQLIHNSNRDSKILQFVKPFGYTKIVDRLITFLEKYEGYSTTRSQAIYALGYIGDKRASHQLIEKVLNDEESLDVRTAAARMLAELHATEAVDPLIQLLNGLKVETFPVSLYWLRTCVVYALGRLGDPKAIPALEEAFTSSKEPHVWLEALGALYRLGMVEAFDLLVEATKSSDYDTRYQATWVLAHLKDPIAIKPLTELLTDEDEIAEVAADALSNLDFGLETRD